MAPSITQPPPPSVAAGHTHTRSSGKGPRRARSSKFAFPHPTAFPRRPRGPAGAKELIPARSLPPSTPARLPRPSPRAAPFSEPGPANPRPGPRRWPPLHASHRGGESARRGFCLQLPGSGSSAPGGSSSSCPCFPRPPSSNLTFRGGGGGGRGVPACAARAVGRGLLAAEAGGAVPGTGGVRASERSPRSQVTHGSGQKPWREKGAGAQLWSHYRRPRPRPRTALKPATRRGRLLGSTRPRAALLGLAAAAAPRTGRGDARREGRGEGAAPGTGATSSLPPTARGVADVRPCSGGFPASLRAETPGPHLAALGGGSPARAWTFARGSCWEALQSGCGGP